jgi:hypothetical protein
MERQGVIGAGDIRGTRGAGGSGLPGILAAPKLTKLIFLKPG